MVKLKDDYKEESEDSRFKEFDKQLDPSYGQKQYYILLLGLAIIFIIFTITTIIGMSSSLSNTPPYEAGLNISYIPNDKIFSITFTNPQNDTLLLASLIQVPFDVQTPNSNYLTVYQYSSSKFPININYTPSERILNINHFVTVTLIKDTGNYTYIYSVIPDTENKMWSGSGKYIQQIEGVFNKQ
jgi:hypothetical protein